MISIRCQCGEMLEAPGSMAWETLDCPVCHKKTIVPGAAERAWVKTARVIGFAVLVALPFLGVALGRNYDSADPTAWLALLGWYGVIALWKIWWK